MYRIVQDGGNNVAMEVDQECRGKMSNNNALPKSGDLMGRAGKIAGEELGASAAVLMMCVRTART